MKAPPESTKASLNARLNSHVRSHWPTLASIDVRWRANFAYIDGRRTDGMTMKLCRLRYNGSAHLWGFAIYRARLRGQLPAYRHYRWHRRTSPRLRLRPLPQPRYTDELTRGTTSEFGRSA